jgi:hypothetical protein
MWQGARAWVSGSRLYFFRVPAMEVSDWELERFQDPDELLDYVVSITQYLERNHFVLSKANCGVAGCPEPAAAGLTICPRHQVAQLQKVGLLPRYPSGRRLDPYDVERYERDT